MLTAPSHLNHEDTINFGSYYTPGKIVDLLYNMLVKNISNISNYTIVDTSCGYGNFLCRPNSIGADIDEMAVEIARQENPKQKIFHHNSLLNVKRAQYNLPDDAAIIIVGNPPYNDTTSIIRNDIKREPFVIDGDLKTRDLGMSFLLSYNKLAVDFVCVLHPLSYLIKKANFESLGAFKNNYKLKDCVVISSGEFSTTSRATKFPIVIALYERILNGMTYDFINNYLFKTLEGPSFKLNQFDKLSRYITKYPNQNHIALENTAAFFWTMRDINALKRTRTFMEKEAYNSIRVTKNKLAYYCYADVFKEYIGHLPYYFGNSEVMINHAEFEELRMAFMARSLGKYPWLRNLIPAGPTGFIKSDYGFVIEEYFKNLLGEHYVD
jgi:hypothetical protein